MLNEIEVWDSDGGHIEFGLLFFTLFRGLTLVVMIDTGLVQISDLWNVW